MTEYALFAFIVIQAAIHFAERRFLVNLIMHTPAAHNAKAKPPEYIKSAHDRVLERWRKTEAR